MSNVLTACPACTSNDLELIASGSDLPVNSCLLLDTREEAQEFPRGDMAFTICQSCGFCFNAAFDPAKSEYSARYEETQGYSPTFVDFARGLAKDWVDRYDLQGRTVLEVGCGSMGDFLQYMVDAGAGHAIGIDPALNVERIDHPDSGRFEWIADFYSEAYNHIEVDAIVCRHTLEHIPQVRDFMTMIRAAIGDRTDTIVLFELPDVQRVLDEVAFWDVYYEHCSYFSLGSLARLFRATGFEVINLGLEYDGQYLTIEARPSSVPANGEPLPEEADFEQLRLGAANYREGYSQLLSRWSDEVTAITGAGGRWVIWGAGSKGVSFLTNLAADDIDYAVDVNPAKHGFFMAGTGQEIVGPEFLADFNPELVVAMNPIYVDEIQRDLDRLGVSSRLTAV